MSVFKQFFNWLRSGRKKDDDDDNDEKKDKRVRFFFAGEVRVRFGRNTARVYQSATGLADDRDEYHQLERDFNRRIGISAVRIGRLYKQSLRLHAPVDTGVGRSNVNTSRRRVRKGSYYVDFVLYNRNEAFYMYIINYVGPHVDWINRAFFSAAPSMKRAMDNAFIGFGTRRYGLE